MTYPIQFSAATILSCTTGSESLIATGSRPCDVSIRTRSTSGNRASGLPVLWMPAGRSYSGFTRPRTSSLGEASSSGVVLFARERKNDGRGVALPYHCLGRAHYRSHELERPIKVLWELERPMPGWLYQTGKVVAG